MSSRRCRRYIGAHRSRSKDHQRVEGVLFRTLRMKSMGRFNRLEQTECEDVQGDSENGVSALSRRKQGFESPRERQSFQELNLSHRRWCPGCVPGSSSARPTIGSCVSAGSVLVALSDRHTKTFNTSEFESSRPSHAVGVIRQSPVSGRKAPELRGFAQSNFVRRPKIRHFRATQCANGASVSGRTFQMSGLCRTIPKRFRRATISNSEMPGGSLGISPPHSATPGSDPK